MCEAIKRGTCPVCGALPAYTLPGLTPWFCSNTDCDVLAWDPYSTLEENLMDAQPVQIIEKGPGEQD